jgi:hypothetical protein
MSWSTGGSPEGEAKDVPSKDKLAEMMKESLWHEAAPQPPHVSGEIVVKGDFKLTKRFVLDGLYPTNVPRDGSFQIFAEFPDGRIEPVLWLDGYTQQFAHVFLLRTPLELPIGTVITGIPPGSTVALLPPSKD